ncbi:hypothetical protein [Cellulomonas uda]|uniref:Uncharacterized protein n=1 Tax=Cellulomonas uda TaxID=1714 RepID=A0A4Y3K631_CELUD|nr:hypothetical protein [Cellulomonas uda]NII67794.1 hypothetical protein [Cellulomonas uda]GEA79959.1 hypothetical protein CUD01_04030 [Cellulomonas uda]
MSGHIDGAYPVVIRRRPRPPAPAPATDRPPRAEPGVSPELSAIVDDVLAELREEDAPYRFPAPATYVRPQHARPRPLLLNRAARVVRDALMLAVFAAFCAMLALVAVAWFSPDTVAGPSL